ncbi:hypothetical protein [Lewinella sp. 4G2]|uniref:hypothetical protein n=1 Tax=Lewinella sp. 4G2 TaxID=1803372 RepID=UPI0007B4C69B|nr:hypothetical protein [Lewinella sp. 4G2]OAV45374.1 hypothetical protein A3850_013120 [Lewinella sp. 4G2]
MDPANTTTFFESDLEFTFPSDWTVRKFDDTTAYQSLSGHGLKGVDFIAISPDDRLWLIEVKNFRPRRKGSREYRAERRAPTLLASDLHRKFVDSVRLINIVQQYLHRSRWRSLQIWYRTRVRPDRNSNYWFWQRTYELCGGGTRHVGDLEYVVWMETPEANNDYDVTLYQLLSERMPVGASITVAESDHPQGLPIRAKAVAVE